MRDGRTRYKVATAKRAPAALLLVAFAAVVFLLLAAMWPHFALAQVAPVLDAITPTQADRGTQVTLSGSGFGDVPGRKDDVVFSDNKKAGIVSWSATEIVAVVPDRAIAGDVVVDLDGVLSNAVHFTVGNPPVLDSLSSDHGPHGSELVLYGTGFGDAPGRKDHVVFSDKKKAGIVSWSDTEIVAVVPDKAIAGDVVVDLDGVLSNGLDFVPLAGLPALESLSTYAAPRDAEVTFYGTGFGDSPAKDDHVTFAGKEGRVVSWSDTEIVAKVPRNADAGYAGVVVSGYTTNGLYFIPFDPPSVTGVDKTEGLPGDLVTITGERFGKKQEDGWVTFAGTPGDIVAWSDTEIQVTVPEGARAGYIGVVVGGVASNGVFFVPFEHPAVASVSPEYVLVGDSVTVTGQNFGDEPDTVVVGGVPIVPDTWSDTEATFTVPETVTQGYAGVQRDGVTSNGVFITIAPRVDALSIWWTEPGGSIAIRGVGFGNGSDGWASLSGQQIPVESWSDSEIVVTIPEGSDSGMVGVVRRDWATSNGEYLVVQTPATISGVDTTTVMPGQQITIDGADFGPAAPTSVVLIGGVHECAVDSWSDSQVVATVPDGVGPGYLGVFKEAVSSNGVWMEVETFDPPHVDAISSWWGLPGDTVSFAGTGFGDTQGAGYPVFAGTPADVVSWSDTEVVATVPAGAETGYAGIVQNGITSNGAYFMPYAPPVVSSVSTDTAMVGDRVTVTGEGFRDVPGLLTVGGVEVTPANWTASEIVFDVPAGIASGYVGVTQDDVISNGVWLEIVP